MAEPVEQDPEAFKYDGGGRNNQMVEGAETVREPQFHTMQQQRIHPYVKSSVLDNLLPTGNGMADPDRQRLLLGVPTSPIGQSGDTFDRNLWLRSQQRTALYRSDEAE